MHRKCIARSLGTAHPGHQSPATASPTDYSIRLAAGAHGCAQLPDQRGTDSDDDGVPDGVDTDPRDEGSDGLTAPPGKPDRYARRCDQGPGYAQLAWLVLPVLAIRRV